MKRRLNQQRSRLADLALPGLPFGKGAGPCAKEFGRSDLIEPPLASELAQQTGGDGSASLCTECIHAFKIERRQIFVFMLATARGTHPFLQALYLQHLAAMSNRFGVGGEVTGGVTEWTWGLGLAGHDVSQ